MNKEQEYLDRLIADRRSFLKGVGLTSLGVAGATVAGSKLGLLDHVPGASRLGLGSSPVAAASLTDADILNFALNLEYLEAEFYTVVVTGKTLEESGFEVSGTGTYGPTTGGSKVTITGTLRIAAGYDVQFHHG